MSTNVANFDNQMEKILSSCDALRIENHYASQEIESLKQDLLKKWEQLLESMAEKERRLLEADTFMAFREGLGFQENRYQAT